MKHTVEIKENGNTVSTYEGCSKKEAILAAKKESNENNHVFISGYNGQCTVYLNPNGNYEPTGKSW
jgi:hypothetical protein